MLPSGGPAPSVSVVIPMYNAERWIRETLMSVAGQTFPVLECIVVDDGSTDESVTIVRDISESSSVPIRLIQGPNRGVSLARNAGIDKSTGDLVAFLDADDLWNPRKLELQVELLEDADAGMCTCGYEIFDSPTGRNLGTVRFGEALRAVRGWFSMEGHGMLLTSTALVRRSHLERFEGFHHQLWTSADLEFILRLSMDGSLVVAPQVLVGYRSHEAQMHRVLSDTIDNMTRIYDKAFPALGGRHFERRCRANLDAHSGYNLLLSGDYAAGLNDLRKSIRRDPRRVVTLAFHAAWRHFCRRMVGWTSRRRFFEPIAD
ncbi:MAG: glycosyltransferase [Actinomycetota bacterium]|nr:glycosyltransferase [Actinomycetota bacterium]